MKVLEPTPQNNAMKSALHFIRWRDHALITVNDVSHESNALRNL